MAFSIIFGFIAIKTAIDEGLKLKELGEFAGKYLELSFGIIFSLTVGVLTSAHSFEITSLVSSNLIDSSEAEVAQKVAETLGVSGGLHIIMTVFHFIIAFLFFFKKDDLEDIQPLITSGVNIGMGIILGGIEFKLNNMEGK